MKKFLNDFVSTLTNADRKKATQIISDAQIDKAALERVHRKLSDRVAFGNVRIDKAKEQSLISSGLIAQDLRDSFSYIQNLYQRSNQVRDLLVGNCGVLTSEITRLNEEITSLEKSIDNYAFLLADASAYDFAFIEPFNDVRGRDDKLDFQLGDRAGKRFVTSDRAPVDPSTGVLTLPSEITNPYPIIASLWKTNFSSVVSSDTGVQNLSDSLPNTGWRASIRSPAPLISSLDEFSVALFDEASGAFTPGQELAGAQAVIEVSLTNPVPADSFSITPFSDIDIELIQVLAFSEEGNEESFIRLLEEPQKLTSKTTLNFTSQSVHRFRVYIRQEAYTRNVTHRDENELIWSMTKTSQIDATRDLDSNKNRTNPIRPGRLSREPYQGGLFQDLIGRRILNEDVPLRADPYRIGRIRHSDGVSWGAFSRDKYSLERRRGFNKYSLARTGKDDVTINATTAVEVWRNSSPHGELLRRLIAEKGMGDDKRVYHRAFKKKGPRGLNGKRIDRTNSTSSTDYYMPRMSPATNASDDLVARVQPNATPYRYTIGVKNITVGSSQPRFKGVYISRILPAPGDAGEVRMKTKQTNYLETNTTRDEPSVTSVEYSVTNQSRPDSDEAWAPIMPIGTETVVGERFFPDAFGKGFFRFGASTEDTIKLFKNGYEVRYDLQDLWIRGTSDQSISLRSTPKNGIIGLRIPQGEFSAEDIFTINYTPVQDYTVVNFDALGFERPPLVSALDNNGLPGEKFSATGGELLVDLSHEPHINYDSAEDFPYIVNAGHTGFTPIVVQLADGTFATNFTNYVGGFQSETSPTSTQLQFIHSGTTLLFNKPITQEFRVFYQHLQNNLRFRVVLRANVRDFVSPKVDYVQLKAKTRRADVKRF